MEKKITIAPCAMSVAGSDSGSGAGIQADLLVFAAHGVHCCTVISALTAQNPKKVSSSCACPKRIFSAQLETVFDYYRPTAAKTGMLFDSSLVRESAKFFGKRGNIRLVVDPVMISTSGARLLTRSAVSAMKKFLFPLAELITPNLDEAEELLGKKIGSASDAAKMLAEKFGTSVLLKGGHIPGNKIVDILAHAGGGIKKFESPRIKNLNTHGSGCTLSAAITANMASGKSLEESCSQAKLYLEKIMKNPVKIAGELFMNRFIKP